MGLGGYHFYSQKTKTPKETKVATKEVTPPPAVVETKPAREEEILPPPPTQPAKQPERKFAKPAAKPPSTAWSYLKVNKDEDSEFYVDGEYYDLSDSNIVKLKPGTHKIKLTKPGFRDIEANIAVKKGETATINVKTGT